MIIDGKAIAAELVESLKPQVNAAINFVVIVVGDNPASLLYVGKKQKACEQVGINMKTIRLETSVSQFELNDTISSLSHDSNVHAILLQLPLPKGLNAGEAISYISPEKDVDGLTIENFGKLAAGEIGLVPCTARGIVHALKVSGVKLSGADVCVIGRSNIVGKPVSMLLTNENATVSLLHSKTKDMASYTKKADIIIVATGRPNLLKKEMVKKGAVIVDVGINRLDDGRICGDVDFKEVSKVASKITPVPGGVGPLTISFLISNIIQAYSIVTKGGN